MNNNSTGFATAIWNCGFDGKLISFEGSASFDSFLGNAHRRSGIHLHDVLLICLQRSSARISIQEFESLTATMPPEGEFTRKLTDIVLADGTFARQTVIIRPSVGFSVIWTEISDIRREAVKYRRQANHDPLTGLMNRRGFELSVAGHRKTRHTLNGTTLLLIDLDNFKQVNDKYGHDSGDRVLMHTADCLRQVFGISAFIARIGGDEFAVLHTGEIKDAALGKAARKLQDLVCRNEFAPGDDTGLGISLGAVKLSDDPSCSFEEMLRAADEDMYAAKTTNKLHAAYVLASRCEFHFQPIVDTANGSIRGFEALLRNSGVKKHEEAAGDLIAELKQHGQLAIVERESLSQVAEQYHALKRETGLDFEFSINVCDEQWADPGFGKWLVAFLKEHDMPQSALRVELLEDINVDTRTGAILDNLRFLSETDIRVDLDDFGTAGASLERLSLPAVCRIKVPRRMIKDYWETPRTRHIVDAILSLAGQLEHSIVIEGVEEQWQFAELEKLGCSLFQGYYFAKPMAGPELFDWVSRSREAA